ncbi:GntR family transcriptional regulator [Muricoccus aerilatus]|uniref:GntR family transcriptional regulator n=1 Tax=Muricoccus aerilatus TaxID=452982 RepID=UPI0005C13272|nr:GntR family transcriptional regulator [Roseomonas aerilata]
MSQPEGQAEERAAAEAPPPLRPLRGGAAIPRWLQLKHALRDHLSFDLSPGDRIPTEAEIGAHYGLSRITVRQAVTSLVDEGLLHRQQGRGTFVRLARREAPLQNPGHFLSSAFDEGPPGAVRIHAAETVPAPNWVASRLEIATDAPAHKIRRLLERDGRPVAIRTSFVPLTLAPDLLSVDLSPPLHLVLEEVFGLIAREAQERIEVIRADSFRARLLTIAEHEPLVMTERVAADALGQAIECTRTYYRADGFSFTRTLRRDEVHAVRS